MAEKYTIENIIGDSRTRFHQGSMRVRDPIFIADQRVMPRRKIDLTPSVFKKFSDPIKALVLDGKIILNTPEGMKITSTHRGEFILTRKDGAVKMLSRGDVPECFFVAEDTTKTEELVEEVQLLHGVGKIADLIVVDEAKSFSEPQVEAVLAEVEAEPQDEEEEPSEPWPATADATSEPKKGKHKRRR